MLIHPLQRSRKSSGQKPATTQPVHDTFHLCLDHCFPRVFARGLTQLFDMTYRRRKHRSGDSRCRSGDPGELTKLVLGGRGGQEDGNQCNDSQEAKKPKRMQAAKAAIDGAKVELEHFTVLAPIDGAMNWLDVYLGAVSRPGTTLWGERIDLSEMDARCDLTRETLF